MKYWTQIAIITTLLNTTAPASEYQERAQKIADLYKMGTQSLEAGEIEAARASFKAILRIDPNHGHARYQLGQLKSNHSRVLMARRKALFKSVRLEIVDFEDAPLTEVLETLNHLAEKATKKKFSPNFVIQDPAGKLKNVRVTLSLKNVPLSVALKYSMDHARASVRYDSHATVITPLARVRK